MKEKDTPHSFDFWDKLKYLFSNPNKFFEKIKAENGINNAILTYLIITIFMMTIKALSSFVPGLGAGIYGEYGGGFLAITFFIGYLVIGFIGTFLYAGITHIVVFAFKGKKDYFATYKVCTYSIIPFLLLVVIPWVGYLSIIYSFILTIIGLSKVHEISKGKAVLASLATLFLLLITSILLLILFLSQLKITDM